MGLQGLPFDRFDIRVIIVEVTRGVRWLEVDSELLPRGYAKVAVLGRDVIYARLSELSAAAPAWPLMRELGPQVVLPHGWEAFHQRVLDEELEEEMRRERKAFYDG